MRPSRNDCLIILLLDRKDLIDATNHSLDKIRKTKINHSHILIFSNTKYVLKNLSKKYVTILVINNDLLLSITPKNISKGIDIMQIYDVIKNTLNENEYNCRNTISILKSIEEFNEAYVSLNSKKRNYTLEDHTIMVCQMFENYFAEVFNIEEFSISGFRLLLCLHDIGKPKSLKNNDKVHQCNYTIEMIDRHKNILPFSKKEFKVTIALVSDDPLGLYIRKKIEKTDAILRIKKMITMSCLSVKDFMNLLLIYYQVDAGAYTAEGYIGEAGGFFEKPKLEAIFQKSKDGKLCFSKEKGRFIFSEEIEKKVLEIYGDIENG